jgi:asparagine synthase (glutamine-hydrolysing)
MSIQFGVWNLDGRAVESQLIRAADPMLAAYAPDGGSHYQGEGITLIHHALHTTAESRREKQPYVSSSGAVIVWDGRLDNREELIQELEGTLTNRSTDVEIVGASFDRWETACFAKLIGDWAVSIWNERDRLVILAKDFAGVRPLYYMVETEQIQWSSVLDPLVTLSNGKFELNHEYVAGWLSMYPPADSSPFVGIRAVPPSAFVALGPNKRAVVKYWDFASGKRIIYRTDGQYEEHFRGAFREAVRRRLRSDRPICAELSGGMDSPSITCMADLIASSSPEIPEIHTLSFYDNSEPHADERPYFAKVEKKLGRTGCHIDTANMDVFRFEDAAHFAAAPASVSSRSDEFQAQYRHFLESNGIRVVLSGIGGDEMTGGVPSPISELQDLMVQCDFRALACKLKLWALAKRKPWHHLAVQAMSGFLPLALAPKPKHLRPVPWLELGFVRRHRDALSGFGRRVTVRGSLPSLQANLDALEVVRRQMATMPLATGYPHEKRYPFLDRTLLELIFAIPREQILRPGYRRSLLRRALTDIVPPEILGRRRKAYASRGPRAAIVNEWERVSAFSQSMISARLGIVDESVFLQSLLAAKNDDQSPLIQLIRTIVLEAWLRNLCCQGVMVNGAIDLRQNWKTRSLTKAAT